MLLIDDRQGSADLIPYFPMDLVKKIRLDAGDVAFFGHGPEGPLTFPIGIEYKTVNETIQCITSRRFVGEQYIKMSQTFSRIYFLLEGEYTERSSDGRLLVRSWEKGKPVWACHGWNMTYRQFDNWQNSLAETGKVIFKRSMTRPESVAQILDLYYMWTKDYDQHKSLFAFSKAQLPTPQEFPTLVRLMAAQIPGIGWQRSKDVAAVFKTPYEMVTAGEDTWKTISGIGTVTAKKAVKVLTNPN